MTGLGRIAAAFMLAAFGTFDAAWGTETPEARQARFLLFSSSDLWSAGGFSSGGVVFAPRGLDSDGPVLKLMLGGGIYRYRSGALGNAEVLGRQSSAQALPGWRWVRGKLFVTGYLGLDIQRHQLLPDDPSAGLRGRYTGARAAFELWYEPSETTMLAAHGSVSSIGPSYDARLAAGWRVLDRFYAGPEIEGFAADGNYRQWRVGLHVTGFKIRGFDWSAGLGFARDSDRRSGAYGKLGVFTRR